MKYLMLLVIRFYQYFISPLVGDSCRFTPTCSNYAKEVLNHYNFFKATYLILHRLLRCNPFFDGGDDPASPK